MNKLHILIIAAGVGIIIAFSLYTFSSQSPVPKSGTKESPVNSMQVSSGGPSTTVSTYINRENPGNFYSIQFPSKAAVEHGNASGSYTAILPQGVFSVRLVDIPDNSDVPLVLLTQIQPALKSSFQDFNRVSYNQFIVGGHRAWDLAYTWKNATIRMESIKAIVEGSDNAAAITFSGPRQEFGAQNTNSTVIVASTKSFSNNGYNIKTETENSKPHQVQIYIHRLNQILHWNIVGILSLQISFDTVCNKSCLHA